MPKLELLLSSHHQSQCSWHRNCNSTTSLLLSRAVVKMSSWDPFAKVAFVAKKNDKWCHSPRGRKIILNQTQLRKIERFDPSLVLSHVWTAHGPNHSLHASNPIYMNGCCKRQLVNTDTHLNWKQFSTTKHKREDYCSTSHCIFARALMNGDL